jgi:hypothetical protein
MPQICFEGNFGQGDARINVRNNQATYDLRPQFETEGCNSDVA